MNKETDDARWQGKVDTTLTNMRERLERLEKRFIDLLKFLGGLVLALAALYLRSVGIIP